MKHEEPVALGKLIELIRAGEDTRGESYYYVYGRCDVDDADLTTECFPAEYPEVTDDDEEVDIEFVQKNQLERWFSDQLIQDVVTNALHQNKAVSDDVIVLALKHYLHKDCFMDIKP